MPEPSNILLIMTDQQRGDCLSIEEIADGLVEVLDDD
jgi:hypothetical protein